MTMDLSLALELAAERYPEAAAIISPALRLNYREWNRRVHAVAWQLSLLGVKPGDYVAICTSGGEAPLTMYFAVMRLGAVAVMLNARWKHRDIGCALRETQAKIILFDEETKEEVCRFVKHVGHSTVLKTPVETGSREDASGYCSNGGCKL